MSMKFFDEYLAEEFVRAAFYAQCVEDESGIGMSWADFDNNGTLEAAWDKLSEKKQQRLEKQLERAVSDTKIRSCYEEMDALINSEEEDLERLEELQRDAIDLAWEYFEDFTE